MTDVLGTKAPPQRFRDDSFYGFDNLSDIASMSAELYGDFLETAEEVATATFSSAELKSRVVTCQAQDDATCVRSVISSLGLRIFRRPVLNEELPVYEKVYSRARAQGELHEGALKQTLVALLASAQFLYRMELLRDDPGTQRLGQYEIASRLSYLLWSSAPDDALLTAAESSALTEPEELEAQTTRMWADPKSQRFTQHFAGQWLGANRVQDHVFDAATSPDWSPEVAAAATQEVYLYFDDFLRNDQDYLGFLTQKTHYANAALGKLYGLDLSSTELEPVMFAGDREGFLGLVAYLSNTSHQFQTSAMLRGKFIATNLLCTQLSPPPANVAVELPNASPRENERQRSERVRENPACALCHEVWDPLGLALEHFDPIGKYRQSYPDGGGIDTTLSGRPTKVFPDGVSLDGMSSVAETITKHPQFKPCLAQQVYVYGLGRTPVADVDLQNIAALAREWESGPLSIKELVRRLIISPSFRLRSDGGNK